MAPVTEVELRQRPILNSAQLLQMIQELREQGVKTVRGVDWRKCTDEQALRIVSVLVDKYKMEEHKNG